MELILIFHVHTYPQVQGLETACMVCLSADGLVSQYLLFYVLFSDIF